MANQRITEDFVKHYKLLRARTGNSPGNIHRALDRDPQLPVSIRELDRIWRAVVRHQNRSKRRFIVQTHPEFPHALADYRQRWTNIWLDLLDWEEKKAGGEPFDVWLDRALATTSETKGDESADDAPKAQNDDDWEFDPEQHSAASEVETASDYMEIRADDEPAFSRASGAFKWFANTVGIDLRAIEERFKEFPVLVVPEQVSNKHGIENDRSLFAYLDNVRLAYIVGADLAAIAMCRACTEILIRYHYNGGKDTKLTPLIKETQQKREFAFLRTHNLIAKVDEANQLLHVGLTDIKTQNRTRVLIREWVTALQEIISRAPSR